MRKKEKFISQGRDVFAEEKNAISKTAKEYSLIENSLNPDDSIIELKRVISDTDRKLTNSSINFQYEKKEREINLKHRKIKNLEKFSREYSNYKIMLKKMDDSLKPISFLKENESELIKTSIFEDLLSSYSEQLIKIKESMKSKTPIDNQVNDLIKHLNEEVATLKSELASLPIDNRVFETEREKIFFLGETKSKLELYTKKDTGTSEYIVSQIKSIEEKISGIIIEDTTERKNLTIKMIEEIISEYIEFVEKALENYGKYKPVFDYMGKSLKLRKPKTSFIEPVGSSSNHMFLHLFFSLAMQEVSFRNKSPFVAPFLIIDQPSRPYYGDEKHPKKEIDHSDEYKITEAFKLLNKYIDDRIKNESEFQMIVFEHIPKRLVDHLEHVNIVEEFKNGNALIVLKQNNA